MTDSLYSRLKEYGNNDYYPFHMPGHKRNFPEGYLPAWYSMDITEIDGFDNLYQPQGILSQSHNKAASLYQSEETFFLINGSTVGILCAFSVAAVKGKKVLISRNSHMSVYHGAFLNNADLEYLYPEIGANGIAEGVTAAAVAKRMEDREDIGAVIITSPTYEGVTSDIEEIAQEVHKRKIPLIVDAAHGAHFGFHSEYPENAVRQGADLVIHSMHKTLPAPTQTALLHVSGQLIDRMAIRRYLRIFQTSSPSYPLMAGIDSCIGLLRDKAWDMMENLLYMRAEFIDQVKECNFFKICERIDDPVKMVILTEHPYPSETYMNGYQLAEILRKEYHLEVEMASDNYIIAIFTIMDKPEGINRLAEALCEIDRGLRNGALTDAGQVPDSEDLINYQNYPLETVVGIREAMEGMAEEVEPEAAADRVTAEFINLYPPGIPIAVPGERLDEEVLKAIGRYRGQGLAVHGLSQAGRVYVLK